MIRMDPIERREIAATYAEGTYAAYRRKYADEAADEAADELQRSFLRDDPNHRPQRDSMARNHCRCGAHLDHHAAQTAERAIHHA